MYVEDCVVPVKFDDKNRICLPKALGIGKNLDFLLLRKPPTRKQPQSLYLVPALIINDFYAHHKTIHQLLGRIKQDNYGRISIPARQRKEFFPASREFWFQAYNGYIKVTETFV